MASHRRWLVVGAGGVGGYLAGLLAHAGKDVTLLARGDHLRAIRDHGLRLETVDASYRVDVRAFGSVVDNEPFDVVLFCVKTYSNRDAAIEVAAAVAADTVVISIQNGMDNERVLDELLPTPNIYPGLIHIVSERVAPGLIRQSGGPRTVIFGDPDDPTNATLQSIAEDMRNADIDASAAADIERSRWEKFTFIVAFAGMTALCRCPIGPILYDQLAMGLYRRCIAETIAVAQAGGIDIGSETAAAAISRTEAYRGGQEHATSSLLRDILAGRRTEIDALNGAVVGRAKKHRLDAPVNSLIYSAIKLAQPTE